MILSVKNTKQYYNRINYDKDSGIKMIDWLEGGLVVQNEKASIFRTISLYIQNLQKSNKSVIILYQLLTVAGMWHTMILKHDCIVLCLRLGALEERPT